MEKNVKSIHFDAIDGLRTYSAIGIVAMHVLSNGFSILDGFIFESLITSFGSLVFLFMVVSAFGMCCGYYEKIKNRTIDLSRFYAKRFRKIFPFFALLVALDIVISPSVDLLYEAFADLTLAFGLLPNGGNISVIGVGWFLGLVFVFYMLFPFFVFLIENKRKAWFSFLILLVYNLICADYFDINKSNILYSGSYFMAGGLVYLYKDFFVKLESKFRYILLILIVIFGLLYFFVARSALTMIPLFSLMLSYSIASGEKCRHLMLSNSITRFISAISMEIYLSHMMIYRALEKMNLVYIFGKGTLGYITALCAVLIGVIAFSFAVQKMMGLIESKISKR